MTNEASAAATWARFWPPFASGMEREGALILFLLGDYDFRQIERQHDGSDK